MPDSDLYIGLMSGTSADGIDAVLAQINPQGIKIIDHYASEHTDEIRQAILALCHPGDNEIERMGSLDYTLGVEFAKAANQIINNNQLSAADIKAIGSHGQTIRHRPPSANQKPFSLQIGNPNIIAQNTGIDTISDFRGRDIACGGEGAPLVPAFHQACFGSESQSRVIVNIGGMANLSILPANGKVSGFDSGPGNVLLDAWINKHQGLPYDKNGEWSASGSTDKELLEQLLAHPFFSAPPPKSTGREAFNLEWLEQIIADKSLSANDVQATLVELTATSISNDIKAFAKDSREVYICGGGAYNTHLLSILTKQLPEFAVEDTNSLGIHPQQVEATAFAWLAYKTGHQQPSNCPEVTGAKQQLILGGIYQA